MNRIKYRTTHRAAAVALHAGLLSLSLSSIANACSKSPVTIQRWSDATTLFIGRATSDTVRAGPGDVEYTITEGHFGRAGDRIIHGQLVDVETLSAVDQKLLPAGVRRVVLVPWDYGADCRPTPWTRSARWLVPGTRGIYNAVLRNKSHWVNGTPVLDVYSPEYAPYTGVVKGMMRPPESGGSLLSVDELYRAVEYIPDASAAAADPHNTNVRFLEWARANRSIAEREPLRTSVYSAVYQQRMRKASNTKSPLHGTYRFVRSITGEADREFFLRTPRQAQAPWNLGRPDVPHDTLDITRASPILGLEIHAVLASTFSSLPATCSSLGAAKESYVETGLNPELNTNGAQAWSGQISWRVIDVIFGRDASFTQYKDAWERERPIRYPSSGPTASSRIFFGDGDGVSRIHEEYALADGRTFTLRGERVSTQVHDCKNDR